MTGERVALPDRPCDWRVEPVVRVRAEKEVDEVPTVERIGVLAPVEELLDGGVCGCP